MRSVSFATWAKGSLAKNGADGLFWREPVRMRIIVLHGRRDDVAGVEVLLPSVPTKIESRAHAPLG